MLRLYKSFSSYSITSEQTGEDLGKIDDMYFDEQSWVVRYLVVDTGGWWSEHRVLIAPEAIVEPDWQSRTLVVRMTREQIERAPSIDTQKPVSRQQEVDLRNYFGWSPYWGIGMTPFGAVYPTSAALQLSEREREEQKRHHDIGGMIDEVRQTPDEQADPNLHSAKEVIDYRIAATDGEIGRAEDFVVDAEDWVIRYLVVDTRAWLPGKKVIVSLDWIDDIDYPMRRVRVDVPRAEIENAPEFDPNEPVNREYEARLYDFYGRPAYWDRDEV